MSVSIKLPCGCHINAAFVLGMCPVHAIELDRKKAEAERDYKRFEEQMRACGATPHRSNYE